MFSSAQPGRGSIEAYCANKSMKAVSEKQEEQKKKSNFPSSSLGESLPG